VTWRPWVIMALGIVALLINGVLMVQEDMPSMTTAPEVARIPQPLRTLTYSATNRRQNFETMGMPQELADLTAKHIARLERDQKKWEQVLAADPAGLGQALCPSEAVPQPYAMLRYLVYEDAGRRYNIDAGATRTLEVQPWYETSLVPALYEHFEVTERRKSDATLMAVSAALLSMEEPALDGTTPWSMGALGAWSFGRLESKNPRLRKMVIEHFGLMHFLTELANQQRGICS
jgi:hypothetical protein